MVLVFWRAPAFPGPAFLFREKKVMKILNLYAGVGGNRLYWPQDVEVHAVETDPAAVKIYAELYPKDTIDTRPALDVLLSDYREFDFIWASPPCTSHSRFRLVKKPELVDMTVYQLLIFLQTWYRKPFCVENVRPYYPLLIPAIQRGRHLLWTNFYVPEFNVPDFDLAGAGIESLRVFHEMPPGPDYSREQLRNCCHPLIGLEVLEASRVKDNYDWIGSTYDWLLGDEPSVRS